MPDDAEALLPRIVEGLAGRRVISAYAALKLLLHILGSENGWGQA
jgi:hypothetical protein